MSSPVRTYDERLWPGPLGWALVLGFALVVLIALVPADVRVAAVAGLVAAVAGVAAAVVTSPRVSIADGTLTAGRAHIAVDLLGPGTVLDRQGVRAALGPGSDARTYVCLRSWIPGAVVLEVHDPQDATPAWLVSTRRPRALLAALRAAQADAGGTACAGDQAAHSEQIG